MVTNGDNGTIGANGSNDDPFETMMIHWSYNGSNGDNGSNDDNGFNDDNGSNGDNGNNKSNDDSGNIGDNDDSMAFSQLPIQTLGTNSSWVRLLSIGRRPNCYKDTIAPLGAFKYN